MTRTNKNFIASLIVVSILAFAGVAQADTVVRTGETVSIAEDQGIAGDFYTAASIINVSGGVEGDLVAAGGSATLNGQVEHDVLVLGGSVDIHGPVGDDLRVIGGEVIIAEPVSGNVFVIGGTVSVLSTASVGGDILVFAGDVEIAGPVGGDVLGTAGTLRIDSEVGGEVNVRTDQLTLGDRAAIEGSVVYVSQNLLVRSQNANVAGDVVRNDPVVPAAQGSARDMLVPVFILLFTALAWFLVARKFMAKVVVAATSRRPRPLLIGVGTVLLTPFAVGILIASVLGLMVGVMTAVAYILTLLLGVVGTIAVAGQFALKVFNQPTEELTLYTLGAGIITVILLALVPVLGPIVLFGLFLLSIGAIIEVIIYPSRS